MWINYKGIMALLEVSHSVAYKIIKTLQNELQKKGYMVNPNRKVPIAYVCERFGIDEDYARSVIANLNTNKSA